jgi:surface polysaccharide O-acyltransferase-like enzyme
VAINAPIFGLTVLVCLFVKREVDVYLWSNLQGWSGFEFLLRFVKIVTYAGYGIVAASFAGMVMRETTADQRRNMGLTAGYLLFAFYAVKLVYSAKVIQSGNWQYNYVPAYWADFLIPTLIFAICFSLANANWPKVISQMAPYSFGIYLVHPIFLDMLEILLWKQTLPPIAFVLFKFVTAVFLSSLLVFLLRKSVVLGWTVGLGKIPITRGGVTLARPRPE